MADVKKRLSQRSVYAALSFSNILRLNLYFPGWGWVGQIKIKDHLSPAEAETWTELGKKVSSVILINITTKLTSCVVPNVN